MRLREKVGLGIVTAAVLAGVPKDIRQVEDHYGNLYSHFYQKQTSVEHPWVLQEQATDDPDLIYQARKRLLEECFLIKTDSTWTENVYDIFGENPETETAYYTMMYVMSEYRLFAMAVLSMQEDLKELQKISASIRTLNEATQALETAVAGATTYEEKRELFLKHVSSVIKTVYDPDRVMKIFRAQYNVQIEHTSHNPANQCIPLQDEAFFREVPNVLLSLKNEDLPGEFLSKAGISRINFTEPCYFKEDQVFAAGWVDSEKPDLIEISGTDSLFHELKHGLDFHTMTDADWDTWYNIASKAAQGKEPYSYNHKTPPPYLQHSNCTDHLKGTTSCDPYALTNAQEDSAVLFEDSMKNYYHVLETTKGDSVVEEKLSFQHAALENITPGFDKSYWVKKYFRDKLETRISESFIERTLTLSDEELEPARALLRAKINNRLHLLGKNTYYYRIFHDSLPAIRLLALLSDDPKEREGLKDGLLFFYGLRNEVYGVEDTERVRAATQRYYLRLIEKRRQAHN